MEENNETQTNNEEPIEESPINMGGEKMLVRKKPNIIWMLATIVFLAATLLELYGLVTTPIPTPAQMAANVEGHGILISLNMTSLNQQYAHAESSRGIYEIGAIAIAAVLGFMATKNAYLYLKP